MVAQPLKLSRRYISVFSCDQVRTVCFVFALVVLGLLVLSPASAARVGVPTQLSPPRTFPAALRNSVAIAPLEEGEWKTLVTPHYHIHFRRAYLDLARRVADLAERVYRQLSALVQSKPDVPIHIVLRLSSDLANGGAWPIPFNYVELVLAPPEPGGELVVGTSDWLHVVLTHEVAHIMQLDIVEGQSRGIREALGRVPVITTPNVLLPTWFVEGFAIYAESQLTGGGRADSSLYEMYHRALVGEGDFYTLDEISTNYELRTWPGAAARYIYGISLCAYLVERYGEPVLGEISRSFAADPWGGFSKALRKVTGRSARDLWRDWQRWLEVDKRAELAQARKEGVTTAHQLTQHGYETGQPFLAPDGKSIAYTVRGALYPSVRLLDVASGRSRQLIKGHIGYLGGLAWSPDSRLLAYGRLVLHEGERVRSDIFIYDLRTGREERITHCGGMSDPAFTPDGRHLIAVSSGPRGNSLKHVWSRAGAGSFTYTLPRAQEGLYFTSPRFSPDGRWLAVSLRQLPGGWQDIFLADTVSGRLRPVTCDGALDIQPVFSPDGRKLFFASDRTGVFNIYAYDLVEETCSQVTNQPYGAMGPAISKEGVLYFRGYTSEGYDLFALEQGGQLGREVPLIRQWKPGSDGLYESNVRGRPLVTFKLSASGEDGEEGQEVTRSSTKIRSALGSGTSAEAEPSGVEPVLGAAEAEVGAEPVEYKLRPYSPWPSLAPKYWVPTVEQDGDGFRASLATSGIDALRERAYDLELQYGLGDYPSGLSFSYQQRTDLFGDCTVGFQLTTAREDYEEYSLQMQGVSVFGIHPLDGTLTRSTQVYGGVQYGGWRLLAGEEESLQQFALVGAVLDQSASGSGYLRYDAANTLAGASVWHSLGDYQLVMDEIVAHLRWGRTQRYGFATRMALGLATADALSVGGYPARSLEELDLRGYAHSHMTGQLAYRGTIELRADLLTVHKWGVDIISVATFYEAGRAQQGLIYPAPRPLASVGGELVLRGVYGNLAPMSWSLGVAYRLADPSDPVIYIGSGHAF